MNSYKKLWILLMTVGIFLLCYSIYPQYDIDTTPTTIKSETSDPLKTIIQVVIDEKIGEDNSIFPKKTKVLKVIKESEFAEINFSKEFSTQPIRPETIIQLDSYFMPILKNPETKKYIINYKVDGRDIKELIPRWYLSGKDGKKYIKSESKHPPLIRRVNLEIDPPEHGLFGKHVILWPSHGWYFDETQNKRWEWQRPRMFTVAEDTHNMAIVNQFLIPMLENAGAVVFSARERDFQKYEAVVDNDDTGVMNNNGIYIEDGEWIQGEGSGFKNGLAPYQLCFNPHEQGTNRSAKTSKSQTATATWIPNIPESGYYYVSISYKHNKEEGAEDAKYTIYHTGGQTTFLVNQTMGGGTWIYLGNFYFKKGINKDIGCVILSNESRKANKIISADAVRFGGGMGSVIRGGTVSGYPRYLEAALYWMQYAGAPADIVYNLGLKPGIEGPDYTNDYAGRGEFANWLMGAPGGPNKNREHKGLGIPIDMCLAMHTDAGISTGTVGFLSIYREKDDKDSATFPDGRPRIINREVADLIQTEVMNTIHLKYSSTFARRDLRDSDYSESRRPNMPCALIESISHQNFNDMKYYLDPRFRFDFARSIYKAILKFLAAEYDYKPIVQPLPPKQLCLKKMGSDTAIISWVPDIDPLEPSSIPTGYMLYMREGSSGFDNGTYVKKTACTLKKLNPTKIYSYKVTAINGGGESFPSETLSIYLGSESSNRILIVNGFDRICAPAMTVGDVAGFRRDLDKGVGYMANYGLTGDQWEFSSSSEYMTNDHPGHGASYGDLEDEIELGNTFDFVYIHGKGVSSAGFGFDSCSYTAIANEMILLKEYSMVDWILGEQRETLPPIGFMGEGDPDMMKPQFKTFPAEIQKAIREYISKGGKLFVSGAYVATDIATSKLSTKEDKDFLNDVLKIKWSTNFGSKTNNVFAAVDSPFKSIPEFHFASNLGEAGVYGVENPDAIEPADKSGAVVAFRYKDAGFSAGTAFKDSSYACVVLGFPFETITDDKIRNILMTEIINFLIK